MANIRKYIRDNLITPMKLYPTVIQETLIESISDKLEELYNYTILFPEIVTPKISRLDILHILADQFLFTIREEADVQEQIDILDHILYVYSKRGSVDTIENMWKYYGGDLPKEVQVIIPSQNLFRYSVSPFSMTHMYQDKEKNLPGMYEIKLTNNTYPIPQLKEFLLKELVAAGNYIYFTNAISLDIRKETTDSYFKYGTLDEEGNQYIMKDNLLHLQLKTTHYHKGLIFSGSNYSVLSGRRNNRIDEYGQGIPITDLDDLLNLNSLWSGNYNIYVEIKKWIDMYSEYDISVNSTDDRLHMIYNVEDYKDISIKYENLIHYTLKVYCTPTENTLVVEHNLYDKDNQHMTGKYFILGESLLNESLGYEVI